MKEVRKPDVAVIGAGPAGLGAALAAHEAGLRDVMLIERDIELGGILPQCIHDGFGSIVFKEVLTGPQYAQRFIDEIAKTDIEIKLDTMVLDLSPEKRIKAVNSREGVIEIEPKSVILAMGCRERTRHQIMIPGFRPAGILCAGAAQRDLNIEGIIPGTRVVILGSGDIGLIMARRFTLEGIEVEGVYEIMDHPGGITRNVVQCLNDYAIPLHLSHTVTFIHGRKRVEGVTVCAVGEDLKPLQGRERMIPCDTLVLSVGLIPENELSKKAGIKLDEATGGPIVDGMMETSVEGIFACGNVVNVFDLVDYVTQSARTAGQAAAQYVMGTRKREGRPIEVIAGKNVKFVVPQFLNNLEDNVSLYFRVEHPERAVKVHVSANGKLLARRKAKMVRPPEMIQANIPAEKFAEAGEITSIEVDVVSDEE